MFCGKCGKENNDDAVFCTECGAPLNGNQPLLQEEAAKMADGASTKNRKIGVIAVAAAAVLVIAFGMLLFGGRSYKKTVNQYVNASFEADAKTIFKLIPAKAVKYGLEDAGYDAKDQKKAIREMKDSMQEQIDYLDRYLGKGWKTSYKITDRSDLRHHDGDEEAEAAEDLLDVHGEVTCMFNEMELFVLHSNKAIVSINTTNTPKDLIQDLAHHAGANRVTSVTQGEAESLVETHGLLQLDGHRTVISGHHHLLVLRKRDLSSHIRRADEELRRVVRRERRVATTLLLRQRIHVRLELVVHLHRLGLADQLTAQHLLALHSTQQQTHVVSRLTLRHRLVEHLHARHHRRHRRTQTAHLHRVAHLHAALLHATRHHRAATLDRIHVLHRHQEVLVQVTLRLPVRRGEDTHQREVLVHRVHQLQHLVLADLVVVTLQRTQSRTLDHGNLVAGVLVEGQQLADLLLNIVNDPTSISTNSMSSGSSTKSILFMKTAMLGTPTWRASRMCSRVWGMGPSTADTTRMAPSI